MVILDGIKGQPQVNAIGRQLDALLRQVMTEKLRFMLVLRTPPDVDMSAYPILAASIYTPPGAAAGESYRLMGWEPTEAARVWSRSRGSDEPTFAQLPGPVRELARTPLYMELLKTAGLANTSCDVNAYRLVDHCIRSILHCRGRDSDDLAEHLADLAVCEAPNALPAQLTSATNRQTETNLPVCGTVESPLLCPSSGAGLTFSHDIFREYFLARRITDTLVVLSSHSTATSTALNQLAENAAATATARGVFDFVVCCLDVQAPNLLATMALSPTIRIDSTLPLLIDVIGTRLGPEVLRSAARRCAHEHAVELSRSLVAIPAVADALGDDYAAWIVDLLHRFGADVWDEVARCVERGFNANRARRLVGAANLHDAEQATFFARYFFLFFSDAWDPVGVLDTLLSHPDWRVRAALTEGVCDARSLYSAATLRILETLIEDIDYKVRAAVARSIGHVDPSAARHYLSALLTDKNWYVRGCALHGLLRHELSINSDICGPLIEVALAVLTTDESWRRCPAQVATTKHRLLLLYQTPADDDDSQARQRALFGLLREHRTGAIALSPTTLEALSSYAQHQGKWLVREEVRRLKRDQPPAARPRAPLSPEAFRRLRDQRVVQIALDLPDLDQALYVARAAATAGIGLVEVGDPLIKHVGLDAIGQVKHTVPGATVVAEMMSADWGRDQVVMAAEAGADAVLLIGPATAANVAAAVSASRRLGLPLLLDIPSTHATPQWIREMERVGVDGFTITTNIDLGVAGRQPLTKARTVRGWTRLPIAVSGGFSPTDRTIADSPDWDILIVGRSIVEAIEPQTAARDLIQLIHGSARKVDA